MSPFARILVAIAVIAVSISSIVRDVRADPGSEAWQKFNASAVVSTTDFVSAGQGVLLVLTNGDANSTVLSVNSAIADVCFDPDIAVASGGAARVSMYRALTYAGVTNAAISIPAIPFDGSDCIEIVRGRYWIEIDTQPAGGETAHVLVQGR